jgi:hypothetical protein
MNISAIVKSAINDVASLHEVPDGVLVTTQCVYPSNDFVQVMVRGSASSFVVSDEGSAMDEIESAGAIVAHPDATFRHLIPDSLYIKDGVIASPVVGLEVLGVTLIAVANASKEIAHWFFDRTRIKRSRNFRQLLAEYLKTKFDDKVRHNQIIVGESSTLHKFDNVILLPSGRRLIVDPVLHEPSSINSRVVAHLDVRQAKYADLEQRMIIDDEDEDWTPANINLLGVGAPVVPFSNTEQVLAKLVNGS